VALDSALLGLIAPLLPEIERRTGASDAELGIALAAYAIPILVVSLPLGRLADRVGRRPLLLGGLALTAAGSILIAFSDALGLLIIGRAVQGVGSAASWIAALALVSDLAPPGRKGASIGFALAANSVGAIAGPALGGLTGDVIGFEFPFFLVAGVTVMLGIVGWAFLPHRPPVEVERPKTRLRDVVRLAASPGVLPATLIVVGGAGVLGLVEVVVPLDGDERLGLSAAAIGALFAATIALDAVAAPVAGGASDRVGRIPVALLGLVVLAASTSLLAVLGGVAGLIAGLAVFGVGISTAFAAAVPWLDDAFGVLDKGFGYGFLNVIYAAGYSIGPLLAGFALEAGGPALAYWGATVVIALLAALVLGRSGRLSRSPVGVPAASRPGA
jgi:predicted MFS family arabinose efflux permease